VTSADKPKKVFSARLASKRNKKKKGNEGRVDRFSGKKTIRKGRYPDAEPALMIDQSKDRRGLPQRLGSADTLLMQNPK